MTSLTLLPFRFLYAPDARSCEPKEEVETRDPCDQSAAREFLSEMIASDPLFCGSEAGIRELMAMFPRDF